MNYVSKETERSLAMKNSAMQGETVITTATEDCAKYATLVEYAEECPATVDLSMGVCNDTCVIDAGETTFESMGRLLQLDVRLPSVCPRRRVALGVILTELDAANNEYPRGLKTIAVPGHTSSSCRDVLVRRIKFVLPESLDVSSSAATDASICNTRRLRVRTITHYIDNDCQAYMACE